MLAQLLKSLFASRTEAGSDSRAAASVRSLVADALDACRDGRFDAAEEGLREAWRIAPRDAEVVARLAWLRSARNDLEGAARFARAALELAPDTYLAHSVLAGVALRGSYYLEVLSHLHRLLRPAAYVEIGVAAGRALKAVLPGTAAVGVDPEPRVEGELAPGVRIFAETSDAFFERHDLREELGGRDVDLAFIDGMHQFEFALRDFINIERYCAPHALILIHDVYPLDEATAERQRRTLFWSGDIWRLVLALRRHRPDLDVRTLACPPTGLALVRGMDPASCVLADRFDEIAQELLAVDYASFAPRKDELLNLVGGCLNEVAAVLGKPV